MTLVTLSNLQYILSLSISSRLIVIVLQFFSNILLEDHNADAYRNKYHRALNENEQILKLLPNSYNYLYNFIQGFTKWDAQYFLEISKDGYVSEQHLAFLPFFPIVISFTRQILFGHTRLNFDHFLPLQSPETITGGHKVSVNDLENYIQAALVGVTINNFILLPLTCILLFALTKVVRGNDEKYAKTVVWWFCFNPASIFFSSCYSEALFACLTFMAMFIIEFRSQKYLLNNPLNNKSKNNFEPLYHLNRLIYIVLPAIIPLALSSATRSNGLINIGFIIFHFLVKYAPIVSLDLRLWTILGYISVALEFIQDILVLLMSSVLAASGYISFQIFSFIKFCANNGKPTKGTMQTKPPWCDSLLPHPYGQVQAKYWNVGLFQYYELKQLPNFLLAIPISLIVLLGSLRGAKGFRRGINSSCKVQHAYYIQAIILTLLCSVSINIQVITRLLLSSCPAIYWICADMTRTDRVKTKMLTTYFFSYFIIGTILHVNFFPWT